MRTLKRISLFVMALFYISGGILHFTRTGFYMQIMPPYVPWHLAMVYITGVAEAALGAGLLVERVSLLAAWGLIALLIAVFPANIYMWTADVHVDGVVLPPWFHALRLPAQALLIGWAYWHTRRLRAQHDAAA